MQSVERDSWARLNPHGSGLSAEPDGFGVIHKKVGPIRLIHCMAHGAWGMASGRIGVKSPFFPLVNFLEKNMGNLGLSAANLRLK
jgi:hypothetical protein